VFDLELSNMKLNLIGSSFWINEFDIDLFS